MKNANKVIIDIESNNRKKVPHPLQATDPNGMSDLSRKVRRKMGVQVDDGMRALRFSVVHQTEDDSE